MRKDEPWEMLIADGIVLSRRNHKDLENDLEIWRNAPEKKGLKVSQSKTEYLKAGDVDDREELKLQGEKVKRANTSNTWVRQLVAMKEVRKIIQAG